ncbi:hypothetical protein KZX37_02845 [Microbacterium sp. EYE_5]|uniref:hypothetical protein n=1 Tax=unclassified Microbacterium TaxID=2609290 RepID=UPI00200417CD|nr:MULTISPECIES: hypothetical protein [unclassified Microbacterium]MCK6079558.1 hypothetical protein [Microbacterium sp. EYE_382]MCK6084829.1 hypothetical protein [Microbacterium sp. EYE_384]MCK6122945.1 hypothetical protein [Microbacterium sp. EYE_80]MCK6125592.1 hypothetical protein [Microbacterium sp. EYE_79]MCK6140513.1 hypothetical protein [Microbacterium sp. EYE_39]
MEWTADVSAGDWLRERIDDPWTWTMHDVVPRGFEAYARVFHPPLADDRRSSWSEAARAFGSLFHPVSQWQGLTGRINDGAPAEAPDGRSFDPPVQGGLEPDLLALVAAILARHTTTPDAGIVALWEGHGGLLGHMGVGPSRTFFQLGDPTDPVLARHNEMLTGSVKDPWNNVFRRETWQEGVLSREISEADRFELPGRSHVLFRGGVAELARPDWFLDVPWRDLPAEEHGFEASALSPSLVWPDDRAWVLVSEVDADSTIVGGSRDVITAVTAAPGLEAFEIPAGSALTDDSDEENR